MSREPGKETEPSFKTPWSLRILGISATAAAAIWFSNNSGTIQDIEPIKVPASAKRIDKQNTLSRVFVMEEGEADSVFCGKVRLRLQMDAEGTKDITPLTDGKTEVECDTKGFDIPVERYTAEG